MKTKKDSLSVVLKFLVLLSAVLTVGVIVLIVGYIFVKGVPNLSADLFAWEYNTENVSLLPALLNTLLMTVLSLFIASPIGIFAAVFLVEYSSQGSRLVKIIRITAETLSGIPSIVYGLFGLLFFVTALKWGMSLIAGACTIALMILPLIMRTTEEALLAVPKTFREGSFGLGAGRLRTVFLIVLPSALPGIMAGIILATGRIAGETAALMYTAGTVAQIPMGKDFLLDSTRTLAVHMYNLSCEGLYVDKAYATAFVLLVMIMSINVLSGFMAKKFGGNKTNG
ncbi:MAG: phosphate ABC transporter permease PstA [Lachnospiraceae bacterium]|nr:phosphate ABC transporter permease PstA [Lachnospiraceae bacterium]